MNSLPSTLPQAKGLAFCSQLCRRTGSCPVLHPQQGTGYFCKNRTLVVSTALEGGHTHMVRVPRPIQVKVKELQSSFPPPSPSPFLNTLYPDPRAFAPTIPLPGMTPSTHTHTGTWLCQVVYISPSTHEFRTSLGYMRPRLKQKISLSGMAQQVKVLALWAWRPELDPWDPCKHRSRELTSGSCLLTHMDTVARTSKL